MKEPISDWLKTIGIRIYCVTPYCFSAAILFGIFDHLLLTTKNGRHISFQSWTIVEFVIYCIFKIVSNIILILFVKLETAWLILGSIIENTILLDKNLYLVMFINIIVYYFYIVFIFGVEGREYAIRTILFGDFKFDDLIGLLLHINNSNFT
jgi:hypothetical protein